MLDIKYIKENKNEFDQALIKRGMEPCGSEIIIKHNEYLNLLNKTKFKEGKIHTKYVEEELLPNY